ncbi:MAG TPA: nitronate monooxygenase [Candidatus Saccharimonadia bacterium]|nr:nitronate monooxygenase [Candidatus Saccharimonadia bacterium]
MSASEACSRLGIEHAIVQGPFGGGLSTVSLAAAVSNLGGLGSYGAFQLSPERIEHVARELGAATRAPYAINLWVSDHDDGGLVPAADVLERAWRVFEPYFSELGLARPEFPERFVAHRYEAQVEALLESRPPVFSFVFGIPSTRVLAECRRRGIVTLGAATSIDEALAIEAAGVDLVVATGSEAGGHRPSFLARAEDALMGTFALAQLVAARVRIPVVVAGGIVDRRGVRAAHALGAGAVQVGTAFLACEESGATPAHRAALFDARAQRTTLTRAFTGRLARGLRNRWTDEFAQRHTELAPFPVTSWFSAQLKSAAQRDGRTDLVSLWSGQAAPNLVHRDAASLMHELIAGVAPASESRTAPQVAGA